MKKFNEFSDIVKDPELKVSFYKDRYYVYRHYYNIEDREITFYVGKGINNRCYADSNRNDLWKSIVEQLNGEYSIDIVRYFDSEDAAVEFEKQLISYYTIYYQECECNKQSRQERVDIFLDELNLTYLEDEIDKNKDIECVRRMFVALYRDYIYDSISNTMKQLKDLLDRLNSRYEVIAKDGEFTNYICNYEIDLRK